MLTRSLQRTAGGASCLHLWLSGPPPLSFCVGPLHAYDILHLYLFWFGGSTDRHLDRNHLSPTDCPEEAAIVWRGIRWSFQCSGHCRHFLDILFCRSESVFAGFLDESGAAGSRKVFATVGVNRLDMCCSGSVCCGEVSAQDQTMTTWPNKPDAVNPAIASRFQFGHHWRGVTDPERWALSR